MSLTINNLNKSELKAIIKEVIQEDPSMIKTILKEILLEDKVTNSEEKQKFSLNETLPKDLKTKSFYDQVGNSLFALDSIETNHSKEPTEEHKESINLSTNLLAIFEEDKEVLEKLAQ